MTLAPSARLVPARLTVIIVLALPESGSDAENVAAPSCTTPPWTASPMVTVAWPGAPSVAPPCGLLSHSVNARPLLTAGPAFITPQTALGAPPDPNGAV